MIFGFNIICGISDETADAILEKLCLKVGKYSFNMPVDNAVRSLGINRSGGRYYLRLNVNAGVLVYGRETLGIEFTVEPDFSVLDKKFVGFLAEIVGSENAEKLPLLRDWILWIMVYGMDLKVSDVDRMMKIFRKTNIAVENLMTPAVTQYEEKTKMPVLTCLYDNTFGYMGELKIYPLAKMIKAKSVDFKGIMTDSNNYDDIIRLTLLHKRSFMSHAKRFLTKFEMNLWRLEPFLNPLVVSNAMMKGYLDTIGNGDFFTYEKAVEKVENDVPNLNKRQGLLELLGKIKEKGSVSAVRTNSDDKKKFIKELKLLRDIGINGAFLDENTDLEFLKNPFDLFFEKCRQYTS